MTRCPSKIFTSPGTEPIWLKICNKTKAKAMEGTYIGEVKKETSSSFPLNGCRLTLNAAVTPRITSMAVPITATAMLLPKPLRKLVEELKIFRYHCKESPLGGNTTSGVGLKEARTITANGASRKIKTNVAMVVANHPTRLSDTPATPHALIRPGRGVGGEQQND